MGLSDIDCNSVKPSPLYQGSLFDIWCGAEFSVASLKYSALLSPDLESRRICASVLSRPNEGEPDST